MGESDFERAMRVANAHGEKAARTTTRSSSNTVAVRPGGSSAAAMSSFNEAVEKLPKGVTLTRMGASLLLQYRWRGWSTLALGAFAILWNAITMPMLLLGKLPVLFIITHGGVGVFVAYRTLVDLFNSTTVDVTAGEIAVRHGPLPIKRAKTISVQELKQLHVRSRVVRTKNGSRIAFDLIAETHAGDDVVLVKDLPNGEVGLVIEHELEQHLGIKDEPDHAVQHGGSW